jgi:hypothetical protein
MSGTARLGLPFLSAGQAQKELFHNEALQTLDVIVAATVEEPPRSAPPASPAIGAAYIVGASATGAWTGKTQSLAAFTSGGWRFIPPAEGLCAYVKSTGVWATYRAGAWELGNLRGSSVILGGVQVVGARASAIADPSGGTVVDSQARTVLGQILSALRLHGLIEA